MSQQIVIDVDFKDEKILIDALCQMGYKPEVHKEAVVMRQVFGRTNADVKANILIDGRQNQKYHGQIGFEKVEKGYKIRIDDMYVHSFNLSLLKQNYTKEFLRKRIKALGTQFVLGEEEVKQDGTMVIKINIME